MATDVALEVAHVLFMDVVGYSKLLINDLSEVLAQLNQVVRATANFQKAEAEGKLIRLATDGMALIFFNNAEAPVKCAMEISQALQSYSSIQLRMGVHSGPINPISDVNADCHAIGLIDFSQGPAGMATTAVITTSALGALVEALAPTARNRPANTGCNPA